jgi:prepilin peptidase CpaA
MHSIAWWPTLILVAVATFTDLRSRRIPNWLVLPFLLAGIAVSPMRSDWQGNDHGFGWHGFGQCFAGLGQSFAGLGLGLLLYGILFWMGGMGAGDVKLSAAIGAWIGPAQLFVALVITAMAGGIMALCWLAWLGFLKRLCKDVGDFIFAGKQRRMDCEPELVPANPLKRKMPYAPAMAIGALISFFAR